MIMQHTSDITKSLEFVIVSVSLVEIFIRHSVVTKPHDMKCPYSQYAVCLK